VSFVLCPFLCLCPCTVDVCTCGAQVAGEAVRSAVESACVHWKRSEEAQATDPAVESTRTANLRAPSAALGGLHASSPCGSISNMASQGASAGSRNVCERARARVLVDPKTLCCQHRSLVRKSQPRPRTNTDTLCSPFLHTHFLRHTHTHTLAAPLPPPSLSRRMLQLTPQMPSAPRQGARA
jgi:hypothetical protein